MATVVNYSTAKSMVISILQASQSGYAATVDGSKRQFASDAEIQAQILTADGEICTLIAKTPLHPYQSQFIAASPATINNNVGASPIRNGMIVRVTGQVATGSTSTFLNTDISTTTDLVTKANHGLFTGQQVQLTTTGALPSGLNLVTTYSIYAPTINTYGFCTNIFNAKSGTLIDITAQGSGTNTVTTQYTEIFEADSKDTVAQLINNPYLFVTGPNAGLSTGFWFVEGTEYYSPCPSSKIYYTDYTLTSSPQAPEPYLSAVVAGAVSKLAKDGFDEQLCTYYLQVYQGFLQEIASNAKMLPEIAMYARQGTAA